MILDSSAIVAVVFKEPEWGVLVDILVATERLGIGAPTAVETAIVLTARLGRNAEALLLRLFQEFAVEVVPFGEDHWRAAHEAYARFGRGQHKAALNFGDCLTYATASLADEPLLCVGEDFKRTDLTIVPLQPG